MTTIEILTAISLFCPHRDAPAEGIVYGPGPSYFNQHFTDIECSEKAWKCIDKARKKRQLCHWGGGIDLTKYCDEELEKNLERCFR